MTNLNSLSEAEMIELGMPRTQIISVLNARAKAENEAKMDPNQVRALKIAKEVGFTNELGEAIITVLAGKSLLTDNEVIDHILEMKVEIPPSGTWDARAQVSMRLKTMFDKGIVAREGRGGKTDSYKYYLA